MPRKKFYGFHSGFAKDLNNFMEYKKSLGFVETSYFHLNSFDEFCAEKYPETNELTSEIVNEWCTISSLGIINRCSQIREFAKYQLSMGKHAYVYPARNIPARHDRLPYILSEAEQEKFFRAVDSFPASAKSPIMEYTAPVVFRCMLSCGFRPREVVSLRRIDFNFNHNTIYIEDSKNHRDRRIAVSEELMDLCRKYDTIAESYFPNRACFFPNKFGSPLSYPSLVYLFHRSWELSGIDSAGRQPSLYSFRFTFATETLMRWIEEGKDIEAMLPYLSAYMGHVKFKDTYYYITLLPERIAKRAFMDVGGIIPEVNEDEE